MEKQSTVSPLTTTIETVTVERPYKVSYLFILLLNYSITTLVAIYQNTNWNDAAAT